MNVANVRRALWQRELRVHRVLLLDYLVAFLVAVTVFQGDSPFGFMIIGGLFAAGLGVRLGGDENMHGTLEYILTRPIKRDAWVRMRFGLGCVLVLAMGIGFLAADLLNLHRWAGSLLAEAGLGSGAPVFSGAGHVGAFAGVTLVYSFAFMFGLGQPRAERVLNERISAVIAAIVVANVVAFGLSAMAERPFIKPWDLAHGGVLCVPYAGALVLISGLAFLMAQGSFSRREVLGGEGGMQFAEGASGSRGMWWILIILIAFGLLALLFYSFAARAPAPR